MFSQIIAYVIVYGGLFLLISKLYRKAKSKSQCKKNEYTGREMKKVVPKRLKRIKSEAPPSEPPMPYTTKNILSRNEHLFYIELKKIADENNWLICPKVGLKDLFSVTAKENYMQSFGKIAQKHVDFIVCDDTLHPLFAIELDDNSHNRKKVIANDEFKNALFRQSGIKLFRIKAFPSYSTEYIERNLRIEGFLD